MLRIGQLAAKIRCTHRPSFYHLVNARVTNSGARRLHSSLWTGNRAMRLHWYWLGLFPLSLLGLGLGGLGTDPKKLVCEQPVQLAHPGSDLISLYDSAPAFPKLIRMPESNEEYVLVGLGVRKVTFLNISVYIAGLYVPKKQLGTLQSTMLSSARSGPDSLQHRFHDPEASQGMIEALQMSGLSFAIRICPVRNTDMGHLRDGFVRAVQSKLDKNLISMDDVAKFKECFPPRRKLPKNDELILEADRHGSIKFFHNQQKLATFDDRLRSGMITRGILMGYLAGNKVISEELRSSVLRNFASIMNDQALQY